MDKKVDLYKEVFNKEQYSKVINSNFKELGVKTFEENIVSLNTVESFFEIYNDLFYDIPQRGEVNSHEYIIKSSSDYINFEENLEEIEILREEIGQLRKELLEEQIKNSELLTQINSQ